MQTHNSISRRQIVDRMFRCVTAPGMRFIVAASVLLIYSAGVGIAQNHDNGVDGAFLPSASRTVSTVPSNGDVNPYGVAFIKKNFNNGPGPLHQGDVLVSNFNNNLNLQGTGTTIMRVPKTGSPTVFFQGTAPLGLSTALGTLKYGLVVVGNFPTVDGTAGTAMAGSLLVINNQGKLLQSITSPKIQGPWDMALVDRGDDAIAFISNALNGTVSRLDFEVSASGLWLKSAKTIASGYMHRGDPAALFVAPTGLVYDKRTEVLYVASTEDNAVFAVDSSDDRTHDDGRGRMIYKDNLHLHGPLGMAMTPNGHLLVANSDVINADPKQPSEIVEFTTWGQFVRQLSVDPAEGGSFGLAVRSQDDTATFAAVDDNTTITIWSLNQN